MGRKLFEAFWKTVSGSSHAYIAAETIEEATSIADKNAPYTGKTYRVIESKGNNFVNVIPLGSDGKTLWQIMEEIKRQAAQEEFFNKHQLKLFEEVR